MIIQVNKVNGCKITKTEFDSIAKTMTNLEFDDSGNVRLTRSLLNTAKLLDENTTLARLKELETLERIFDKVGSISISSSDDLLAQLREIAGATR